MLNQTATDGADVSTDPLTKQAKPLTPQAPAPLPLASAPTSPTPQAPNVNPVPSTGTATTGQAGAAPAPGGIVPPMSTSDPMAFSPPPGAPNVNPIPLAAASPPMAQAPGGPLFGGNEQKINDYWATQGVQVAPSALGVPASGVGANGVNTYDPSAVASQQAAAAAEAHSTPEIQAMLGQLKTGAANSDVPQRSAANEAANATSAADQLKANDASIHAAGGVGPTAADATGLNGLPTSTANDAGGGSVPGASSLTANSLLGGNFPGPNGDGKINGHKIVGSGGSANNPMWMLDDGSQVPIGPSPFNFGGSGSDTGGTSLGNLKNFQIPGGPTPSTPSPSILGQVQAGGGASDATPLNGLPSTTSFAPTVTPAPSTQPTGPVTGLNGLPTTSAAQGGTSGAGYNLSPTTPGNSLANSAITPGPGTDRYAIAKQEFSDWQKQTDPAYQASLRDANRYAFGNGRGYSGIENNSIGDLKSQRDAAVRSQEDTFLGGALNSSVEDAYRNVGIAQQQQGFQEGQQQTAFNQAATVQQLQQSAQGQQFAQQMQALGYNAQQIQQAFENAVQTQQLGDTENNQSFNQSLQKLLAGSAGSPADLQLILAQIYGGDSAAAAAAAAKYYQTNGTPQPTNGTSGTQQPTPAGAG